MKMKTILLAVLLGLVCVVPSQGQGIDISCRVQDYIHYWWHVCMTGESEWPDVVPEWANVQQMGPATIYTWVVFKNPVYLPLMMRN